MVRLPKSHDGKGAALRHQAPVKAAVTAQLATAIAIFIFAPIRLGNLISIRLEENLIRPGGFARLTGWYFPHYDVKNRVQLQFKLIQNSAR